MAIAKFMASTAGRLARVVLGIVLIALGFVIGGTGGTVLMVVGVVPIALGALNVCALGPILGAPFKGGDL